MANPKKKKKKKILNDTLTLKENVTDNSSCAFWLLRQSPQSPYSLFKLLLEMESCVSQKRRGMERLRTPQGHTASEWWR
jgi:hypothetical protein